jgi:hypothetical protein
MGWPGHDTHVGHLESPFGVRPVPVLIPPGLSRELLGLRMSARRKPRQRLIRSSVRPLPRTNPWTWPGPSLVVRSVHSGECRNGCLPAGRILPESRHTVRAVRVEEPVAALRPSSPLGFDELGHRFDQGEMSERLGKVPEVLAGRGQPRPAEFRRSS